MATKFTVGTAYAAVPALEGARKHMCVVIGRQGRAIQLAWVNDLSTERVMDSFFDRELLAVTRPDGDYTISSACPIDAVNAAEIMSMIQGDLRSNREMEVSNV